MVKAHRKQPISEYYTPMSKLYIIQFIHDVEGLSDVTLRRQATDRASAESAALVSGVEEDGDSRFLENFVYQTT